MAEYAYISKDESYALKHYGVKGMKWHKHLKRSFDDRIGLTAKRAYDNSDKRASNTTNQFYKVLSAKDPYKVRGPVALSKNRNPYMQMISETNSSSYDASDRYNKYKKTPLGKIERSSKLGKKAVDAYDRADRSIDKALRKRNVKKRIKNEEKKKLNALLEKGRANAAKEKISTSSPLIERPKEKKRQISKRKTRIPGVTEYGYIKEPQTISGSRKRRRRR